MENIIIVETQADKETLEAFGVKGKAEIVVRNLNDALRTLRSRDMDGSNVIFLVQTHDEDDKFFKSWLTTAKDMVDVELIYPVSSVQDACEDPEWLASLNTWLS
jgi:hypothetical protein